MADGQPMPLGARAFDVLQALIERRERVVTKDELLDLVWPGVVVEENNLQVQISTLRKLLGPQAIATIPGRGYRFTAKLDGAPDTDPNRPGSIPSAAEVRAPAARRHQSSQRATDAVRPRGRPAGVALADGRAQARHGRRRGRHRQEPPRAGRCPRFGRAVAGRRVDGRTGRPVRTRAFGEHSCRRARHQGRGSRRGAQRTRRRHCAADNCCSCSTTASTCSTRSCRWSRPFCGTRPMSRCLRPVRNRCGSWTNSSFV